MQKGVPAAASLAERDTVESRRASSLAGGHGDGWRAGCEPRAGDGGKRVH